MNRSALAAGAALVGALAATAPPAQAVLISPQGLTYSLYEAPTANPLVDRFTFQIDGINGPADTEGGRSGVNAIAFNKPDGLLSAVMIAPPSGYNYQLGGLNSSGCDGSGNFFCFDNTGIPPTPVAALPANSSLDFTFDVTLGAGHSWANAWDAYAPDGPHMKIDWVGTANNYDLVSAAVGITPGTPSVPEPGTLSIVGAGLVGTWFARRRLAAAS